MSIFDQNLQYVKDEVGKILSTSPLVIRKYTEHLLKSEGKYIRACAVLAAAENVDGTIHYDAVKFAASIEVLHLATLVHDDVMDDANVRRGIPTLHKLYGRKTAVICGDYLMAASLTLANKVDRKHDYLDYSLPMYMEEIAMGELSQHLNNGNYRLKMKDYLKIIEGKTAKLFEAAMYAGVATSDDPHAQHADYKTIGNHVGMIFQLLDDVMDFEETERTAKKPVQSDFEQGVVTLPLIHAFDTYPELLEQVEKEPLSREAINSAVAKAGGVKYTQDCATNYYETAKERINKLEIQPDKRARLMGILNLSMRVQ